MRVVLQRVNSARVHIAGYESRSIGPGLVVLAGLEDADTADDIEWISRKLVELRVFDPAADAPPATPPTMSNFMM